MLLLIWLLAFLGRGRAEETLQPDIAGTSTIAAEDVCSQAQAGDEFPGLTGHVPAGGAQAGLYTKVPTATDVKECVVACCEAPTCTLAFFYQGASCFSIACNVSSPGLCSPEASSLPKHAASVLVPVRAAPSLPLPAKRTPSAPGAQPSGVAYGQRCGSEEGLCQEGLVCRAQGASSLCSCGDGSVYRNGTCVLLASPLQNTPASHSPKACEFGLRQCPPDEECQIRDNRKSRRGVCVCLAGLRRSGAGKCDEKIPPLTVAIAGEKELTLPLHSFSLNASVTSPLDPSVPVSYSWSVPVNPADGASEGEESEEDAPAPKRLSSSDWQSPVLTVANLAPGKYTFLVKVSAGRQETTESFNLNVLPEAKPNQPPQARIDPDDSVIIVVEGKALILEGAGSKDADGPDGKPTIYEWAQVSGPAIPDFAGSNSENLKFDSLRPGNYTFSLTVADAQGLRDTRQAKVFVKAERDDPPEAVAGECGPGKPPGDFSVTMSGAPGEFVFHVCGNGSRDDKGITKWAWSPADLDSAAKDPVDLAGTAKPLLTVSNAKPGTYAFKLRVEDVKGQAHETTLRVHVNEASNSPPVADAGTNVTISLPQSSLLLDGSKSHDDGSIKAFSWEQVAGPAKADLANADKPTATASGLKFGLYAFRLNVTDEAGLRASAVLGVNVTRSSNKPPVAKVPDVALDLPASLAVMDGSGSTDDAGIVSWQWSLLEDSPSTLTVLGESDREPKLLLGNLQPGDYAFKLSVTDQGGATGEATATLSLRRSVALNESVEALLGLESSELTGARRTKLAKLLESILSSAPGLTDDQLSTVRVNFTESSTEWTRGWQRLVFFAWGRTAKGEESILRAASVVQALRADDKLLQGFALRRLESLYCWNPCSGHGLCSDFTKECDCERFWMPNVFATHVLRRPSNCDWSVLYFAILSSLVSLGLCGSAWSLCAWRRGRGGGRRRRRLKVVEEGRRGFRKLRNGARRTLLNSEGGSSSSEASAAPQGLLGGRRPSSSSSEEETVFDAAAHATADSLKSRPGRS